MRADCDVVGAELLGECSGVAVQRRRGFHVAALALEVREVVQRRQTVRVVAQRGVESQRVVEREVRRGEVATPHLDHAEVQRRTGRDVERMRFERDLERRAKRLGARQIVARAHPCDAEGEEGARLHERVATSLRQGDELQHQLDGVAWADA
jgi:hypothetical protein